MDPEDITESLFRATVPPHAAEAMERLYQHRYASFMQLEMYGHLSEETHTYVARKGGAVIVALLFRIEQRRVCVLNEQMLVGEEDMERFARCVFAAFESVDVISFPVVHADIRRMTFPHQQAHSTQDIVLTLPPTVQAYTSSLGKSTRSYVKRYLNKLKRDFPEFSFQVYARDEIRDSDVHAIIALNKERMSGRQQSSYIDASEEKRMLALLPLRGFVGVMTINGRVCAGTVNTRFGDNYFLQVVAHDPLYNEYGMGTLCCYLTILECIERQGNAYHFLWGQYEYKYRLLGVQRDLNHVAIYRSNRHLLRNARMALGIAVAGQRYTIRSWLLNKARRRDDSSFVLRLLFHAFNSARNFKRTVSGALRGKEKITPPVTGAEQTPQ